MSQPLLRVVQLCCVPVAFWGVANMMTCNDADCLLEVHSKAAANRKADEPVWTPRCRGLTPHWVQLQAWSWCQQGSEPAERAAVVAAEGAARGGTAYLNLESGSCHGDLEASTGALIASGVPPCPFRKGLPSGTPGQPTYACRFASVRAQSSRGHVANVAPCTWDAWSHSARAPGSAGAHHTCLAWSGVARAVVGLRHPLAHLRGVGEAAMLRAGIAVEVLGEAPAAAPPERCADALSACLRVNEVRRLRYSGRWLC